jgi:hypothetical protein
MIYNSFWRVWKKQQSLSYLASNTINRCTYYIKILLEDVSSIDGLLPE